jgi:hypothetical protein
MNPQRRSDRRKDPAAGPVRADGFHRSVFSETLDASEKLERALQTPEARYDAAVERLTALIVTTDIAASPNPGGSLLEREDIEITELGEAGNSCKAVAENRTLTLRVIESAPGRSRLSLMVGGGSDGDANDRLAKDLLVAICGRLSGARE